MNAEQKIETRTHVFLRGPADGFELQLTPRHSTARIWITGGDENGVAQFSIDWLFGDQPDGHAVAIYRRRPGLLSLEREPAIVYDFCGYEQPECGK